MQNNKQFHGDKIYRQKHRIAYEKFESELAIIGYNIESFLAYVDMQSSTEYQWKRNGVPHVYWLLLVHMQEVYKLGKLYKNYNTFLVEQPKKGRPKKT
jgi:hypothetical protein